MFQYHCLNPIAEKGLGLFDEEYKKSAKTNLRTQIAIRDGASRQRMALDIRRTVL